MASTIVTLADAVVAELNAGQFGQQFTAKRLYRPRYQATDLKNLQVTVVPKELTIDAATRSGDLWECQIDVAVQKKLSAEIDEDINPLIQLAEDIARHFKLRRPANKPDALCVKAEVAPIYAVEHLDELRTFTCVITLTFRLMDG